MVLTNINVLYIFRLRTYNNIFSFTYIKRGNKFNELGFFIPLLFEKFKNFKSVFLIGLLSSLSIEATQFLISLFLGFTYRNTDIDDIILNVIGCVFGFIIYKTLIFISKGKFIMEI